MSESLAPTEMQRAASSSAEYRTAWRSRPSTFPSGNSTSPSRISGGHPAGSSARLTISLDSAATARSSPRTRCSSTGSSDSSNADASFRKLNMSSGASPGSNWTSRPKATAPSTIGPSKGSSARTTSGRIADNLPSSARNLEAVSFVFLAFPFASFFRPPAPAFPTGNLPVTTISTVASKRRIRELFRGKRLSAEAPVKTSTRL